MKVFLVFAVVMALVGVLAQACGPIKVYDASFDSVMEESICHVALEVVRGSATADPEIWEVVLEGHYTLDGLHESGMWWELDLLFETPHLVNLDTC